MEWKESAVSWVCRKTDLRFQNSAVLSLQENSDLADPIRIYLPTKCIKRNKSRINREPKLMKLVYVVPKFDQTEIEKAVLFAINNALVCETPEDEDAIKVTYEIDRSQ